MTSPALILKSWNLRPKKGLGQNFLTDRNIAHKIVNRSGLHPEDIVLEIGSGLGALTLPMAHMAKKIYAVEKDNTLIPALTSELLEAGLKSVVILNQDILSLDVAAIAEREQQPLVVMGNIPYNISSQIFVQLIMARQHIKTACLMFQKELAQRIMASPGSKAYGRLAVMAGYCSRVSVLVEIPAARFFPKPKVDSLVLKIAFGQQTASFAVHETFFYKVVKASFSKRRKTLKNALSGPILKLDAATAKAQIIAAGIDPVRRAETLTVDEFVKLSNQLYTAEYR